MSTAPASLAIIAAVAANRVIGRNNALPWRLPEDLRHFRRLTLGHRVVMGRKTCESLDHPLAERDNVVITRQADFAAPGFRVVHSLEAALTGTPPALPVFCIGGAQLYREALPRARTIYLTQVDRAFAGDAFFPEFDGRQWEERSRETHEVDGPDGFQYHFVVYQRIT